MIRSRPRKLFAACVGNNMIKYLWKQLFHDSLHSLFRALCSLIRSSGKFSSFQSCPTLCDPKDGSMPGLPVYHQLAEFTQTHVHLISDAIQPSHPLLSPSPGFSLSQYQGLFEWVSSVQFSSATQSCPTLCDPMDCSTPKLPCPSGTSLPLLYLKSFYHESVFFIIFQCNEQCPWT